MERIFDIQWFDWWEWDDIYRLPKNGFYSGEGIEVRKNLSWVYLAPKLTDTGWSISGNIIFQDSLEKFWVSWGGVITCTDTGKIYLNGTLKTTLSTGTSVWNQVYGIWVTTISGTQYVYYITATTSWAWKIHRSTTSLWAFNVSYRSFTVSNGTFSYVWVINNAGLLYLAIKNMVFILDESEVVTDYLTLPDKEEIRCFTQSQNTYRIYTKVESTTVYYVWDWASTSADYRQEWYNMPILWWVNDWVYDYVVLGFNENYANLYEVAGLQKTLIRANLDASTYSRVFNQYVSIRQWIVYISWGKTWESTNYWIYTYGRFYPWTPKSLVQQYSGTTSAFLHHCHSSTTSYFACSDNKVYTIEHNNPPENYATSGYIVSQMYQWNLWEEKNFSKIRVWFILNGGAIDIYVRTSFGASFWTSIATISWTTSKGILINNNQLLSKWIGSFYELQYKFVLTPSWGGASPVLSRVTTFLNTTDKI